MSRSKRCHGLITLNYKPSGDVNPKSWKSTSWSGILPYGQVSFEINVQYQKPVGKPKRKRSQNKQVEVIRKFDQVKLDMFQELSESLENNKKLSNSTFASDNTTITIKDTEKLSVDNNYYWINLTNLDDKEPQVQSAYWEGGKNGKSILNLPEVTDMNTLSINKIINIRKELANSYKSIAKNFVTQNKFKEQAQADRTSQYISMRNDTKLKISTSIGLKFCLWSTYSNETLSAKLDDLELLISGASSPLKNFSLKNFSSALSTAIAPYDCFTNLSLLNFDNDKNKLVTINDIR